MSERDPLLTNESRREYRIVEPPYERSQNDEQSLEQDNNYAETGPTESTRRHDVVFVLVLMVLAFERIGYFSLNNDLDNLILNMEHFLEYRSVLILCIRAGGQFIFPLIGAWFGECLLGVHTTAVSGTVLELIGSSLLLISIPGSPGNGTSGNGSDWLQTNWINIQEPTSQDQSLFVAGLVLVMLGLALTRPNYLMLAAVQIPEQKFVSTGVIRWYLFAINFGAAVAIGGLGWTSMNVRAFSWPVCFFVSLVLLIVVRCASNDQLNRTNTKGFRKMLACFSHSAEDREQLSRLSKHLKIIFLFIGLQLPYFFLYATLDIPVVFGDVSPDWLVVWNLFEPVSIIIIVLATFLTIPVIKRYFTNTNYLLKCITFGKLFITISCFITILLDQFLYHLDVQDEPLYVGCYFPQFFMIGLSEVFCYMKALEFVYVETPKHLKNQMIGLFLTLIGLGYCMSLGFAWLIRLPGFALGPPVRQRVIELSILGGFQLICIVPFVVFFRNYEYRKDHELSVSVAIDGSYIFGGDRFEDSIDSNNLFGGD